MVFTIRIRKQMFKLLLIYQLVELNLLYKMHSFCLWKKYVVFHCSVWPSFWEKRLFDVSTFDVLKKFLLLRVRAQFCKEKFALENCRLRGLKKGLTGVDKNPVCSPPKWILIIFKESATLLEEKQTHNWWVYIQKQHKIPIVFHSSEIFSSIVNTKSTNFDSSVPSKLFF